MRRVEHQKDLYKKLIKNESFRKEADTLRAIFRNSAWWVSEDGRIISPLMAGKAGCPACAKGSRGAACRKRLSTLLKKSGQKKEYLRFGCGGGQYGLSVPIVQGDKIYGYLVMCHSAGEISENHIHLIRNFLSTLIRELQKESELAKLYKTIRPRAIALSTIHTIHRIISSTLDLDELLPKLARLCLQVFRANLCYILLKGQHRKPPLIKIVGRNEKKKSAPFTKKPCAKILVREGVLSKGKTVMKKNRLCTPLTDEDIIGAICVTDKIDKAPFDEFDKEILMTLAEQAAIAIKNAQLYKEQENITVGSIKSLAAILDTRTPGTHKVKESFVKIVLAIGRELNLNAEGLRALHYAALLHDAGQIVFADTLLTKADRLTGKEYSIIKRHPRKTVSIIKHLSFLKPVIPIILHHHENYDGSGYPKGLRGEEIPLGARIMTVANAFNAMITERPYRKSVDVKSAAAEIRKNSGTQFDPLVVEAFLEVIRNDEIVELLKKGM